MFFDPNSTREYLAAILFLIIQLRNPCTGVAPRSLCQMSQAHGYLRPHPRHRYAREPFKTVAKEIELARLGLTQFSSAVDRRSLYKRRSTLIRATPAAAAYLRGRSVARRALFLPSLLSVSAGRSIFAFPSLSSRIFMKQKMNTMQSQARGRWLTVGTLMEGNTWL